MSVAFMALPKGILCLTVRFRVGLAEVGKGCGSVGCVVAESCIDLTPQALCIALEVGPLECLRVDLGVHHLDDTVFAGVALRRVLDGDGMCNLPRVALRQTLGEAPPELGTELRMGELMEALVGKGGAEAVVLGVHVGPATVAEVAEDSPPFLWFELWIRFTKAVLVVVMALKLRVGAFRLCETAGIDMATVPGPDTLKDVGIGPTQNLRPCPTLFWGLVVGVVVLGPLPICDAMAGCFVGSLLLDRGSLAFPRSLMACATVG